MKTTPALLVAALALAPALHAQDEAGNPEPGVAPGGRPRPGRVLRLRGVADGEMLKLFALDVRFRKGDGDGARGGGLVRIGEDTFHAKVTEVEFEDPSGTEPEPVPAVEDDDEPVSDENGDETEVEVVSDETDPDGSPGEDGEGRRRRRPRVVRRLVAELYAMDSMPVPEPMPAEVDDPAGDEGEDGGDVENADGEAVEIAPVEPPPETTPIGKIALERSSSPLGDREVPVAMGEASLEGASWKILARAPMPYAVARRVRRTIRRHREGGGGGQGGRGRGGRGRGQTDANTGGADSVDGGF